MAEDNQTSSSNLDVNRMYDQLKVQEDQVQDIIRMLKEEFSIENKSEAVNQGNGDENSEDKDTGFDEPPFSTTNSNEDANSDNKPLLEGGETQLTEENLNRHNSHIEQDYQDLNDYYEIDVAGNDREEEDDAINSDDDYNETVLNEEREVEESEREKYEELVAFINKAKDYGANALDLSKKGLKKLPRQLLQLTELQYIYLEGNQLARLPRNFFQTFPLLKWLDLRNNCLTELPCKGIETHEHLRYILLDNNKITRLPVQLSALADRLTALNLAENPIEYPPADVVKKGCKQILEYLGQSYKPSLSRSNGPSRAYEKNEEGEEDLWASDNEDNDRRRSASRASSSSRMNRARSAYSKSSGANEADYYKILDYRIKSATRNLLVARSVQYDENRFVDYKQRLNRAKDSANKISKSSAKGSRKKIQPAPPVAPIPNDRTVYRNEDFEKALQSGKVEKYKRNKERIDARLQKVNDQQKVNDFRQKMRNEQRKLAARRMRKGVDYLETVYKAPFDISEDYVPVMTNKEREFYDKQIEIERNRPLSPTTLLRIEDERRSRDNYLQDKIREYTNRLLARRQNQSTNPLEDKLQAARDIRELKAIQREIEQRRQELQYNLRAYTGGMIFKETKKLNSRAKLSFVMRKNL